MSHSSAEETAIPVPVVTGRPADGVGRRSLVRAVTRERAALIAITLLGGALRFSTLGLQSFDSDEAFTVHLSRLSFGRMLAQLPKTESTPPLHYVLVWVWGQVFGTGEVGLRSFSALCGMATIPVLYAVASRAFDRRAGLAAALLAACNPFLVWYSQEARSYALLALLAAASLYYFLGALDDPRPRELAGWAITSALALTTHYFALFLVAPETVWLLYSARPRRRVAVAAFVPLVTELAVAPLAYAQRHPSAGWSNKWTIPSVDPLSHRIAQLPRELLFGFKEPVGVPATIVLGLIALYAVFLLVRAGNRREHRVAIVLGSIAAVGFVLPIAAAILSTSLDLVETRFFIAYFVAVVVVIAGGLGLTRSGRVAAIGFAALSLVAVVAVSVDPADQRFDIRGAVSSLGASSGPRLVLVVGVPSLLPQDYLANSRPAAGAIVKEIDVIAMPVNGKTTPPSLGGIGSPQRGFSLLERRVTSRYTVLRFRARTAELVSAQSLVPGVWPGWTHTDIGSAPELGVLLQRHR